MAVAPIARSPRPGSRGQALGRLPPSGHVSHRHAFCPFNYVTVTQEPQSMSHCQQHGSHSDRAEKMWRHAMEALLGLVPGDWLSKQENVQATEPRSHAPACATLWRRACAGQPVWMAFSAHDVRVGRRTDHLSRLSRLSIITLIEMIDHTGSRGTTARSLHDSQGQEV
jgi:hypothetical protein